MSDHTWLDVCCAESRKSAVRTAGQHLILTAHAATSAKLSQANAAQQVKTYEPLTSLSSLPSSLSDASSAHNAPALPTSAVTVRPKITPGNWL